MNRSINRFTPILMLMALAAAAIGCIAGTPFQTVPTPTPMVIIVTATPTPTTTPLPTNTPAPTPTDDLQATIAARLANALPTHTPTPTVDLQATIAARLANALPTGTPTPADDLQATITARLANALPTHTPTPADDLQATIAARLANALPTHTPVTTLIPAPRRTPTLAWQPPNDTDLAILKQLMLEMVNAERAEHGAPPVRLGHNPSAQIHAEQGLANCYSSHWDLWGLKPLYRYSLTGGDQYAVENASGIDYCPKASDNYRINHRTLWPAEVRETVNGWIGSPGHRRTMLDPHHTVMHAGIAIGKYHANVVQVFSGDYVTWEVRPYIAQGMLTASGHIKDAFYDESDDYVMVVIEYHQPTNRLTPGQLAGTYCLENDFTVGLLNRPLQEGWYYTDRETGREYTDYITYTEQNSQCVNPYELPPDRPAPTSWSAASAQYDAAVELSLAMPDEETTAYRIVAESLDISDDGRRFSFRANLSPILSHYGPGVYTIIIWATTPDGESNPVALYPIWWHTEPTSGHPY